jgi:hypothetical protein
MRILQFCENILRRFHQHPAATPREMWLGYNAGFNLMPGYKKAQNPYLWGSAQWAWWKDGWLPGMGELTREKRAYIEDHLLPFAPSGPSNDPWFSGTVKEYWDKRIQQLKEAGCISESKTRR